MAEQWGRNEFERRLSLSGEVYLLELCDLGQAEHAELEFKENANALFDAEGNLTKVGRAQLAKEISAFANTSGGTIVMGVRCKRVDGIEQATALDPIPHVERALTSVSAQAPQLTDFAVPGLDVRSISSTSREGGGYIVLMVPRSDSRPHRANAPNDKAYYQRVSNSSLVMPHAVTMDMASRVVRPVVDLQHELRFNGRSSDGKSHTFHVGLCLFASSENSRAARHVSLQWTAHPISGPLNERLLEIGNLPPGTHRESDGPVVRLFFDANYVVYTRRMLCSVNTMLYVAGGKMRLAIPGPGYSGMELDCTLSAEEAEPVNHVFQIDAHTVWTAIGAPPLEELGT